MNKREALLTQIARKALEAGDYRHALLTYADLAMLTGSHLYRANIELVTRRAKKIESENIPSDINIIIELAQHLARKKEDIADFSESRVALITRHACHDNKHGRTKRGQLMTKRLRLNGWEVLRIENTFDVMIEIQDIEPKSGEAILRHINTKDNQIKAKTSAIYEFISCVERFREWFKAHKPQVVVAVDDFTSALPAIVAARQLSLPVIKEQLHYADAFKNWQPCIFDEGLDFIHRFEAEKACLSLSSRSHYLYPDEEDSWDTLQRIMKQVCHKKTLKQPLTKLKPKGRHSLRCITAGEGLYYIEVNAEDAVSSNSKGIVAAYRFLDSRGRLLEQKLPAFASNKDFPQFNYIETYSDDSCHRVVVFQLPAKIHQVEIDIVAFTTQDHITLWQAKIGKVSLTDVARWISLNAAGIQWIKSVENFVNKEGAVSLYVALLEYKYRLTKKANDERVLNSVIREITELDPSWVPRIACRSDIFPVNKNSKMTVAHLHKTAYPYESTGGSIRCLNTVLSQNRIDISPYIITPIGYPRTASFEGAKNYEVIEGIDHYRIGANVDGLRSVSLLDRYYYSAFYIAKLLKQRGADVIHAASGVRGYELALQALALKKLTGLPLLYEVRSFHEHTWTHLRSDAIQLERTQLRIIKENYCMKEADFVTTISSSMKQILIERGVSPEKVEVIPNAIDETKYLGRTISPIHIPELKEAEIVIGYISNMSRREGHQYLIRSIHQLRQRTGRDIRGLLVGNGPERGNLENLAAELNIIDFIFFSGEIDHSQIDEYYKAIDIFVVPRIPDYAADWVTPLKPYEAMALERPIIVSDLPALREIVGNNQERGLVAKPADVESLTLKLQKYIEFPAMRHSKVQTAKDWVFAERTWSANAKRYRSIYQNLIKKHDNH